MKRIRVLVPVLALALALLPSSTMASTPVYHESVSGVETGQPTACGPYSLSSFAGIARGDLNGVFQIAVCHDALPNASIYGGSYWLSDGTTTVRGLFGAGGTVSPLSSIRTGSLCVEKFRVSGGPLHLDGRLVHYGHWTGTCNIFFATISGSADIPR